MNERTQKNIKIAIVSFLGISYFLMHTVLTVILRPEGFWVYFLIFAFGFIAKGLEYFVTIPSAGKTPWMTAMEFRIGGYAIPLLIFITASRLDAFGFGKELRQTAVCIFVLLCFNMMKKIAEIAVYVYGHDEDDDDF